MIKSFLYITSVLALMPLAACSEIDEPAVKADPARYITFASPTVDIDATVDGFDSRAVSRINVNAPIQSFRVWGFCQANGINGSPNKSSIEEEWNKKANFFTTGADVANLKGDVVTLTQEGTTYNGGMLTKWITGVDPQYSFIAVEDLAGLTTAWTNSSISSSDTHGPRMTITLPMTGSNINNPLDYNNQTDVKVAWAFDKGPSDSPIELQFMHIMTGIRFKFQNITSTDLEITGFTYAGQFYKQAVFNFDTNKPVMSVNTTQTYSGTFSMIESPETIGPNDADYLGGADPVTLLLLPNPRGTTNEDGNYTLGTEKEINITYRRKDEAGNWGEPKTKTVDISLLKYTPKPNTLHTATFSFVGDGFITNFKADNEESWEDGSNSNITIH